MNRWLAGSGLLFLAAALVFLNQGVKKSAVRDHDEDEQAQQQQASKAAVPSDPKTMIPSEEAVGDPAAAKHHIAVGWVYDEANQEKPETLTQPIQGIRDIVGQSAGFASAEIVNLDVPLEDRTPAARAVTELGIHIDNQPVSEDNLSEAALPRDHIIETLQRLAIKKQ